MAGYKEYLNNLLRWRRGRQETGYEKMLLLINPWIIPFDCYLIRYRQGDEAPVHTDPVTDKRHYRLNLVIKKAKLGGEFHCEHPIYESDRLKFFRPDVSAHSVTKVVEGVRYILSVGWVLKQKKR
jgi:hypothetical protein